MQAEALMQWLNRAGLLLLYPLLAMQQERQCRKLCRGFAMK